MLTSVAARSEHSRARRGRCGLTRIGRRRLTSRAALGILVHVMAVIRPGASAPDVAPRTLGDVLYARRQTLVSEEDWVRLVEAIGRGDQRALHALYQRTHRLVFTLIVRITRNPETAEELTVDVFHDVWRRASTFDRAKGTVVGWIMNQARSRAIDRVRFDQRKKRVNQQPDDPALLAVARDPLDAYDLREQAQLLREALNGLRSEERRLFTNSSVLGAKPKL